MNKSRDSSGNSAPKPPLPASNRLAGLPSGQERKAQLLLQHPDESPEVDGTLPYLIHPPSRLSTTASWILFRDKTLIPLIQQRPEDPNLPKFLSQANAILAWRATVPPEDRFWKADPPKASTDSAG